MCKYLFVYYCFLFCFLPPESYVKLLISAANLPKEKSEVVEKLLTEVVESYVKFNENSKVDSFEALKAFTDHLVNVYHVVLVTVGKGSVIIILDCPSLESLELLWSDYRSGHLDKVAERYLLCDEIKKKLNLETVCLKSSIEKENYVDCRRALVKLHSTSSGQYKKSV